jgi:hypothetical protein
VRCHGLRIDAAGPIGSIPAGLVVPDRLTSGMFSDKR